MARMFYRKPPPAVPLDSSPVMHRDLVVASGVPAPSPLPRWRGPVAGRAAVFDLTFTRAPEYAEPPHNNGAHVRIPGRVAIPRGQQTPAAAPRPLVFRAPARGYGADAPAVGSPECPPTGGGA